MENLEQQDAINNITNVKDAYEKWFAQHPQVEFKCRRTCQICKSENEDIVNRCFFPDSRVIEDVYCADDKTLCFTFNDSEYTVELVPSSN